MAAEPGHHPSRAYFDRDGNLHLNGAKLLDGAENEVQAIVAGLVSGVKVATGEVTLDGSNPTPIVTGLATVTGCTVTLKQTGAPGDDPVTFTVNYGGGVTAGTVNLYAWKTDGTDPTLVASTNSTAVVSWVALGT